MSYRKITVADIEYEYVIGKRYTKIKGRGTVGNWIIGATYKDGYVVTPAMVACYIRAGFVPESEKIEGVAKTKIEQSVAEMRRIKDDPTIDVDEKHGQADALLCKVLKELGYEKLTEEWYKVEKWYA